MKNGEKEGFDVNDVSAYLELIQSWRDNLRDMATSTLQMQGIEEHERDNLERALRCLPAIDELVKIIGERPYTHVQAHALSQLWSVIAAAFIIGNRGSENPVSQKFLKDKRAKATAQARDAKRSDKVNEIVTRCRDELWKRKPGFAGNKTGTATEILAAVNSELENQGIKSLNRDALRKRIVLPLKLEG